MDDLNSVLVEGTLIGPYDSGKGGRFSEQRIDILTQRATPRQGRKSGSSRLTVDLSKLSSLDFAQRLRRGSRLRVVGYLDRPERGNALIIAEHVEVKPVLAPAFQG